MDRSLPIRLDLSKLTFVVLALAVSIIGWGLQYKLSLYQPHTVTHSMPEAKLLARDESNAESGGNPLDQQNPRPLMAATAFAGAFLFLFAALNSVPQFAFASRSSRELERTWLPTSRTVLHALFFRPPPSLA